MSETCEICVSCRAEESAMSDRELDHFGAMCNTFALELVPYLLKCLHAIYPPASLAQVLGVSQLELTDLVSLVKLQLWLNCGIQCFFSGKRVPELSCIKDVVITDFINICSLPVSTA